MTINKCSIFTPEVEKILLENKITNWIWWQWFNLETLFKTIITEASKYIDVNKLDSLFNDVKRLSMPHDILFTLWWSKVQFYFANYIFVRDLDKLLNWVWFLKRMSILIIVFMLLNRHWKKYFNFK